MITQFEKINFNKTSAVNMAYLSPPNGLPGFFRFFFGLLSSASKMSTQRTDGVTPKIVNQETPRNTPDMSYSFGDFVSVILLPIFVLVTPQNEGQHHDEYRL